MTVRDLERIAEVVAQKTLQTWNDNAGFGDEYFRKAPCGQRIVKAATDLLRRCLEQENVPITEE